MVHCQTTSDQYYSSYTDISLLPHKSQTIISNAVGSQTTVTPTASVSKTKKRKHHHHKHKHHHKKYRHDTSEALAKEQDTSYTTTATTFTDLSYITTSTLSRTTTKNSVTSSATTIADSTGSLSTKASYDFTATVSDHIASTTSNNDYFTRETPTPLLTMNTVTSSKPITLSFSRSTSRLLAPPRDRPMRNKDPISSSLMISASTLPSPSIIQPIPAKATISSSTREPAPMAIPTNGDNDDDSSFYRHKAQIHSSNRDLGLGLGLGFGGFSILALAALLIQNYKKRQRNHSSLRTSNHIDNNGVFFTETPSMFKRKSASRQSRQSSFISTKWRPQSFLGVVAGVIAAKFSSRGPTSNSSSARFDESGTVDYDPLTYPQPLYSPVKASYQEM